MGDGKIDLQDGCCVSCGRESGVIYHSCPFCDEMVWHPIWRRVLFCYVIFVLPAIVLILLAAHSRNLLSMISSYASFSWWWQLAIALALSLLLMPYDNPKLIYTSTRNRTLWLLNSLAASFNILVCAMLIGVCVLYPGYSPVFQAVVCIAGFSSISIPAVMNCDWWRLLPAVVLVVAFVLG